MKNARRKKRRKYITGIHVSKKCPKVIKYKSSWEAICCIYFDLNDQIVQYIYEPFHIPYISNIKTKKIRKYYPDFLILLKDGSKKIIEIKPRSKLYDLKVIKKSRAAEDWCQLNGYTYEFWTDAIIKNLDKTNKATLLKKNEIK